MGARKEIGRRQDAVAMANAYGTYGVIGEVVCDGCGRQIASRVLDTEPHRDDCPVVQLQRTKEEDDDAS